MSEWFEIEEKDAVELSEDKKTIEILFNTSECGNQYIDVPVGFISDILVREGICKNVQDTTQKTTEVQPIITNYNQNGKTVKI